MLTISLKVTNHSNLHYIAEADKNLCAASKSFFSSSCKAKHLSSTSQHLGESPPAKDKERDLSLFVWESCSAVVSSTLVTIGPVGCFSPAHAENRRWLMDWFVQSLLGCLVAGCPLYKKGFNIPGRQLESDITSKPGNSTHKLFTAPFPFDKCRWLGDLRAVQCWKHGLFLLLSLWSHC